MSTDFAVSAAELDARDPLRSFRNEFVVADNSVCYLDGNSLGRQPRVTAAAVNQLLDEWGSELVMGWQHWVDEAQRTGDLLGQTVLGADAGQVLACDTTSVNFYQLCVAAVRARPGRRRIITDAANFPTDRYILEGIARDHGLELVLIDNEQDDGPHERISPELLATHLSDDVALVSLQVVQYRSGARNDVRELTALAHRHGALVVWDASHAVGAVPLNFDADGVDLAVGCTYKYLNAGPGSPAWLYVRRDLQPTLRVPIQGWFAQADQFGMGREFERADGIRGFQVASPSIVGLRAINASLEVIAPAGIEHIAAKAALATELMVSIHDEWLAPLGFTLLTPRSANERGGHIRLGHPEADVICQALRVQHDVITDFRVPDSIRVAASPLTTSFAEIVDGMRRLRDCVASRCYLQAEARTGRVT